MLSLSYGSDEHYRTPAVAGTSVTYENAKQVETTKRRLVSVFAFNSSAATVYLALVDSADAGATGTVIAVFPVFAGSFISHGIHGGDRMEKGIYLKAYTNLQLTVAAGAVMFYKVDYTAYL